MPSAIPFDFAPPPDGYWLVGSGFIEANDLYWNRLTGEWAKARLKVGNAVMAQNAPICRKVIKRDEIKPVTQIGEVW
jgi:hypothetical protein